MDSDKLRAMEFIRFVAELPYSESELKEKKAREFFEILKRAESRVEKMNAARKRK